MDKVTGNFLNQGSRDFPLDCETLDGLQGLSGLVEMIGNVGGDKVVLWGCELSGDGSRRGEGYVFLRTRDCPRGEVLRFEGGAVGDGLTVMSEDVSVSAQGVSYKRAYTRRWLAAGVGTENYSWADFWDVRGERALWDELSGINEKLRGLKGLPLGMVEMWAGDGVPEGYALCDGRTLKKSEYGELWGVIGDRFNRGVNADGVAYVTPAGEFRLPDLRGRFVVGFHDGDRDYQVIGSAGGEKLHELTADEMPRHVHEVKDYYYAEKFGGAGSDVVDVNDRLGSKSSDYDNDYLSYYRHDSEAAGGGRSHENRPPYYVLAYVMRIK